MFSLQKNVCHASKKSDNSKIKSLCHDLRGNLYLNKGFTEQKDLGKFSTFHELFETILVSFTRVIA